MKEIPGRIALLVLLSSGLSACVSGSESYTAGQSEATSSMRAAAVPGATAGNLRVVEELPEPAPGSAGGGQKIAKNDLLEIDVFQVNELDRTVQVNDEGNVSLPLIGEVEAAGKNAANLELEIEQAYGERYLQSPQVSVFVKESVGQRVVVNGQVGKAGIFPVTSGSTLLSIISQAGGLQKIADPSKIFVYRDYADEQLVARYSIKNIRTGRDPDPAIYGGDVVVVFSSSSRVAMENLTQILGVAGRAATFIP